MNDEVVADIREALSLLQNEHVQANKHLLGAIGAQDIGMAVWYLERAVTRLEPVPPAVEEEAKPDLHNAPPGQYDTTDRADPNLGHGVDTEPIQQHKAYLILSEEERDKGFVRPVRRKYIHSRGKACGTVTTMGLALCETYARKPNFYGSTYCSGCCMHLRVDEFDWIEADDSVGPPVGS